MTPLRQQFINALKLKGFSEKTISNYIPPIASIALHYRVSPLLLSKPQIEAYLLFLLQERKLAPATVNLHMDAMKTFFKLMAPDRFPMSGISHVKLPSHIPSVLSMEEIEKMIKVVNNIKHKAVLMLLYSSGLRLQECIDLRPVHIESTRMKVRVNDGKGKRDRYTVLSKRTLTVLRDYFKIYKPKEWLFEGCAGQQYSTRSVGHVVKRAASIAGIRKAVSPHTLRHSFATHLMESGVALPMIQKLLGHSSIKTTMIYLHISESMADRAQSPLDSITLPEVGNHE